MKTVYIVRHRVAGHVSTHVYANPPTDQQLSERKAQADYLYGNPGNKNNWVKVEEVKLVEGNELDPFVPPVADGSASQEVKSIKLQLTGLVGPAADEFLAKSRESMTIGADDVGTVKAEDLVKPMDRKTKR